MNRQQTGSFMISMAFGAMMSSVVSAYVITTILKDYGASIFILALIPVIGNVGLLLSLPTSLALARFEPKRVSIFMYLLARGFILFFILAFIFPDLFMGEIVAVLFAAYAFMNIISASINGICQSWLKQIISHDVLGSIMGRRNALAGIIMGVFTPVIGFAIDNNHHAGENPNLFLWLMVFALVAGCLDIKFLAKVPGTKNPPETGSQATFAGIIKTARNKTLWRVAGISVLGQLGGLILTPFSILLFYELELSAGMVAVIIAVSVAGSAAGQFIGGHYADRLKIKALFLCSAFAAMLAPMALLAVSIGIFSLALDTRIACCILAGITIVSSVAGGAFCSANMKYTYCAVKSNLSVAFAFIDLIKSPAIFCILLGAAKLGGILADNGAYLSAHLWPGCHYIQLVLVFSMGASLVSIWYLNRRDIYGLFSPDLALKNPYDA